MSSHSKSGATFRAIPLLAPVSSSSRRAIPPAWHNLHASAITVGLFPNGSPDGPVAIFLETIRDVSQNDPNAADEATLTKRTVLHETWHHFRLYHGKPGGDEGPLSQQANLRTTESDPQLTPTQVTIVRGVERPRAAFIDELQ